MNVTSIPVDFPRSQPAGSVPGVQAKVLARCVDGQYVSWTDEELQERFECCEDLALQLVRYCQRKEQENPSWSHEFNLERTAGGVAKKVSTGEWNVTDDEQAWVMNRVRTLLGW